MSIHTWLACSKPVLKASYHEFRAFKEWILTALDESESSPTCHPLAISLLEHFIHVFPEDIPSSQPPKRAIQHHMDLIP